MVAPHDYPTFVHWVRGEVDRRIDAELARAEQRAAGLGIGPMVAPLRDLMQRGGKRFRAALVVASCGGVRKRVPWGAAFDAAASVELLHAYLLVQDDWMDGDRRRRGGPAVHVALRQTYGRHGDSSAILASDLAWNSAMNLLSQAPAPAGRVRAAWRELLDVHEQVVLGQQLDLLGSDEVAIVHQLKTGSYTVRGPLLIGAALAGGDPALTRALGRFAEPLGKAFQLRDDLLSAFGDPALTGKRLAGDLRAGKHSAVTVLANQRLDRAGQRALERVFGVGRATQSDLRAAIGHLERCGVRAELQADLAALCQASRCRLAKLPMTARSVAWLHGAVSAVAAPIESCE